MRLQPFLKLDDILVDDRPRKAASARGVRAFGLRQLRNKDRCAKHLVIRQDAEQFRHSAESNQHVVQVLPNPSFGVEKRVVGPFDDGSGQQLMAVLLQKVLWALLFHFAGSRLSTSLKSPS